MTSVWFFIGAHDEFVFLTALFLDLVIGDPIYAYHPIRLLGSFLIVVENLLRKLGLNEYGGGILLGIILSLSSLALYFFLNFIFTLIHPLVATVFQIFVLYSLLALGDLLRHVYRVGKYLKLGELKVARQHVSHLVGRDTDQLDEWACGRAALESLAEGAVDGVWAPLFWYLFFGIPGVIIFKIVSTMDSMVGYKTERYLKFGWFGARADDVMNWIPARIGWLSLSLIAFCVPFLNGRIAFKVGWTQNHIFPSPNSGWPEATLAGALGLKLLGPIDKAGIRVNDTWLGEANDPVGATPKQIQKGIGLISLTSFFWVAIIVLLRH